ncbi:glycerol kinase [Synergistales bacterium]|nr:glycerol kinase [Synergistales bacterium]
MGKKTYVLALDEGTTGTKAFIFDENLALVSRAYRELTLYSTSCGRAELDGDEIFDKSVEVCREAIQNAGIEAREIACMGICAQRSTLMAWEKDTGKPYGRAFSWQDTRIGYMADRLRRDGMMNFLFEHMGRSKATNGVFSIKWMDENVEGFHKKLMDGDIIYGSMDCWMVYRLTGCKNYCTSIDHASLNGMVDFHNFEFPKKFFEYLEFPTNNLPKVMDNAAIYGFTDKSIFGCEIPITCVIADQHAAIFAQRVVKRGDSKCTNGTGAFVDLNIGHESVKPGGSHSVLLAWRLGGIPTYVAECYAPTTGTFQRWIKKLFELKSYKEIDEMASMVKDSSGVMIVPTLFGTVHPKLDASARATIMGLSEACGKEHIMRATLEGIAYVIRHISDAMTNDLGIKINDMRLDGGLASSDIFCSILASVLNLNLERPETVELTALGTAEIAGAQHGIWDEKKFDELHRPRIFSPQGDSETYEKRYKVWTTAYDRSMNWPG